MHLQFPKRWLSSKYYYESSSWIAYLACSLGDQLARWTSKSILDAFDVPYQITFLDDVFKSTVHRAINRTGMERYSIPLFFGTDYDVLLEVCAPPVTHRVLTYKLSVPIFNLKATSFVCF